MNDRFWAGLLLMIALGVLMGFSPVSANPTVPLLKALSIASDTGPLPEGPLTTLNGETVALRSWRGLSVVNFWATWCAPCREELKQLDDLHRQFDTAPVRFLAVNVGETRTVVTRFVREHELSLPVILDPDRRLHRLYEPREYFPMPRTVLVENGAVIANTAGVLPFGKAVVQKAFRNYAREVRIPRGTRKSP